MCTFTEQQFNTVIYRNIKIGRAISYIYLFLMSFFFHFLSNNRCDAEHFLDELGLTQIPEGDWFCDVCVEKKSVAPQSAKKLSKVSVKTAAAKSTSTPQKKNEKEKAAAVEIDVGVSRKRGTEAVISSPAPEGRRSARLH